MQDFNNATLFPNFSTIPKQAQDAVPLPASSLPDEKWYLLAEVKDNMTIMKPTLILADRNTSPFALVFEGFGHDGLDLKAMGFKKGTTAVIPNAVRINPADKMKRGFVSIAKGDVGGVRAVPCPLARVLELGEKVKGSKCDTCDGEGENGLKSCTGCQRAGYCSKECQVKGWSEGGHKSDCKILKTLNVIFG